MKLKFKACGSLPERYIEWPDCCGKPMARRFAAIRAPETWLQCSTCGKGFDMTPDEYYQRAPYPDWAHPNNRLSDVIDVYQVAEPS